MERSEDLVKEMTGGGEAGLSFLEGFSRASLNPKTFGLKIK